MEDAQGLVPARRKADPDAETRPCLASECILPIGVSSCRCSALSGRIVTPKVQNKLRCTSLRLRSAARFDVLVTADILGYSHDGLRVADIADRKPASRGFDEAYIPFDKASLETAYGI